MTKKALFDKSWRAILGGVITFFSVFVLIPEYVFSARPNLVNYFGSNTIFFVEGAIAGAIVVIFVSKLYSQFTLAQPESNIKGGKGRIQELLRIQPLLGQLFPLTHIAIDLQVENVMPDSLAKNLEIKCRMKPDSSIYLIGKGVHHLKLPITYKDPPSIFRILNCASRDELYSQFLCYEATYLNEYNKKVKQSDEIQIGELIVKLEEAVKKEKFPNPDSEPFFPKYQ